MASRAPTGTPTLREWLAEAPYTLALSSGFFGFFAHTGLLAVLEDEGLAPAGFVGSSAGALVGALAGAGLDTDTLTETLLGLERDAFWDPAPGLGFLRGARFRTLLGELLPVREFESCARPVRVSTYTPSRGTCVHGRGELVPAVYGSCAVPLLFQPIRIGGAPHWDGGIRDRHGVAGLNAGERTLHHHLGSRSPWRLPTDPGLIPPRREGLVSLVIAGLPRVGPNALDQGPRALEAAARATRRLLDAPVSAVMRGGA